MSLRTNDVDIQDVEWHKWLVLTHAAERELKDLPWEGFVDKHPRMRHFDQLMCTPWSGTHSVFKRVMRKYYVMNRYGHDELTAVVLENGVTVKVSVGTIIACYCSGCGLPSDVKALWAGDGLCPACEQLHYPSGRPAPIDWDITTELTLHDRRGTEEDGGCGTCGGGACCDGDVQCEVFTTADGEHFDTWDQAQEHATTLL